DLDQQGLLGAEVVVEQSAADARLAGDVLEGRARDSAAGDAGAHRLHDPLRLLPAQLPRLRRFHGRNSRTLAGWRTRSVCGSAQLDRRVVPRDDEGRIE